MIWFPVFILLFGLILDGAMVFNQRTLAIRIMQDANRSCAVGRLQSPQETEAFILTRLRQFSPRALASTTITLGIITSRVTMPIGDLEVTGILSEITRDFTIEIQAQQMSEDGRCIGSP